MKLFSQIKRQEGFSGTPYKCSQGFLTIGYGWNLDTHPFSDAENEMIGWERDFNIDPMTEGEAAILLNNCLSKLAVRLADRFKWFNEAQYERRCVLINLAYNLGVDGLCKFKKMLSAFESKDYNMAAAEMFDSKWRRDVGATRATELILQMATGCWFELT
jgi:lysozyme